MKPKYQEFVQDKFQGSEEWNKVSKIAKSFFQYLNTESVQNKISKANQPGISSKYVQDIVMIKALEFGFISEVSKLFSNTINKLRPDFYLKLDNTGIIIEVERGKTNQNNMDFLDFWKCHICEEAHYLFLLVPVILIQNNSGKTAGKPYEKVISHMSPFFYKENYTNVRGLVIFGF